MDLAEGRNGPRNLAAARIQFAIGAEEGDVLAMRAYSACLAGGHGGPRDWQAALELLKSWSKSDALAAQQIQLIDNMVIDGEGAPTRLPSLRRAHPQKKIGVALGLLTSAECDFLAKVAGPSFGQATVINKSGKLVPDPIRTNEAASFLPIAEWPFIWAINRRIAAITGTDVRQGEPLNVLRYRPGQEYKLHCDAGPGDPNPRILTVLIYLNRGYGGGETHFPALDVTVRGQPGDMLAFANTTDDNRQDIYMQHAGLPVTSGEKLIASRWIRRQPPSNQPERDAPAHRP